MRWEQDILNEWSKEFNVPAPWFAGYERSNRTTKRYWVKAWIVEREPNNSIYLDTFWENKRLCAKAELWHEFCHHLTFSIYGKWGHGQEWKKFRRKKVLLWALDIFT